METGQEKNNNSNSETDLGVLEQMPSFQEHMAHLAEERKKYGTTYQEARLKGKLPEGVHDEQDYNKHLEEEDIHYAEYLKEKQDKIATNARKSREYLREAGCTDEQIDGLFYCIDFEVDDDGRHYKHDENGELIAYINKEKPRQDVEYLFELDFSLKDFVDAKIVRMPYGGPLDDIDRFVSDWYYITDNGYNEVFNKTHRPAKSLGKIVRKHINGEPLDDADRDFAYDCCAIGYDDQPIGKNMAKRLLFGADPRFNTDLVSQEAARVAEEEPGKHLDRLLITGLCVSDLTPGNYMYENNPQAQSEIDSAVSTMEQAVDKNLHPIIKRIRALKQSSENPGNDFHWSETHEILELIKLLQQFL